MRECLNTLDEAASGAAREVQPKFTSHSDPASQWRAARKVPAFFSYSDNYLIDTDHGVIVDVETTRSIRQAEVGSTKAMLRRVKAKFALPPERVIATQPINCSEQQGLAVPLPTGFGPNEQDFDQEPSVGCRSQDTTIVCPSDIPATQSEACVLSLSGFRSQLG